MLYFFNSKQWYNHFCSDLFRRSSFNVFMSLLISMINFVLLWLFWLVLGIKQNQWADKNSNEPIKNRWGDKNKKVSAHLCFYLLIWVWKNTNKPIKKNMSWVLYKWFSINKSLDYIGASIFIGNCFLTLYSCAPTEFDSMTFLCYMMWHLFRIFT